MSSVSERLQQLNITLPEITPSQARFVPARRAGRLIFVSGQVPRVGSELQHTGHVGVDVPIDRAREAAYVCALRCLAVLKTVSSLDHIQIVKLVGYVSASPDFREHSSVIDAASETLEHVLGERGQHARAAIGVASLPGGAAVEVEVVAEIVDRTPEYTED